MNSPGWSSPQAAGVMIAAGWHHSYISEFNKQLYGEKLSAGVRLVGQTCSHQLRPGTLGLSLQPEQEFSQGCSFNL